MSCALCRAATSASLPIARKRALLEQRLYDAATRAMGGTWTETEMGQAASNG